MSRMSLPVKSRRLNLRVLIALGVVVLTSVVGFVALKAYRDRRVTPALLGEAKKYSELKQYSLALGYLNRYLELHPDDLDALDLKAKFLAESAQDARQAMEAMPIHNQVLGRDPQRQETRRRLLELNLKVPGRAKTAVTLARELIRQGDDGPRAHRLLARALEQSGAEGDDHALAEACREYEAAEKHDPGDVEGGERLARLYQEKLHDPEKGQQVLDKLLALNQAEPARRAAVRLARARYCAHLGQIGRAGAEIDQAIHDDPGDPEIRIVAAQFAAQRGDTANARRHLAAIPDVARNDLRIKLIEGVIDLKERRPNEAAQSWRSGLLLTGGSNIELTWRLAQILLEMGRVSEAEPLIAQYRRLAGSEQPNAWYHYLHALSLFKTGRPDEAAQDLEAIRFKADKLLETSLYLLLGQCYEAARNESQALAAFRRTTELSHDLADPWLAIARLQWPRQPNAAIDTIELGLKAIPADPRLLAMSIHYQWQRQTQRPPAERSWDGVERALSRADQLAPGSLEVALVRSEYLQSLGKNEDSLDLLEEVTKRFPKYVPLWAIRARALSRLGRTSDALKLLDQATEAAGPQALLAIDRASILLAQGHVKEAHATLRDALGRVPAEQRPALWKALGEYYAAQSDRAAVRDTYQEYSRLEPNNPEPRILLLDLALTGGDDAAIRIEVSALKAFGGPNSLYWRLARVQELLRDRPQGKAEPAEEASRLEEAERLVQEIKKGEPQSPLGYLLEGRLQERRHETNRAVAAYERAVDRNGGQLALAPLVALLVRERRDADLKRLRQKLATLPVELERLATLQALKLGDKDRAEQLAARMAEGHPEALDVQVWQAQVLKALGKPEAAEAALLRLIRQRPAEPSPWLQLLMLQVSQKRLKDAAETVEQLRTSARADRPELLWAQCYRVAGDLPRAEECYRAAIQKWPDDLAVRASAVSFCEQTGRQAEAEAMLREILGRDPGLGWVARKLAVLLAGHRNDRAAWDKALRLIGPEARPDDIPDDRLTRAHVYALGPEPRHRREALKILEQLATELPSAAAVHELLARVLPSAGDLARAREHAALAAGAGASPDAVALYTRILITARTLDAAEQQLQRLEAVDSGSLPTTELRARLLAARGQGKEAADVLERACEGRLNTVRDVPTGEQIVRLLLDLNQPEAATRVARKVGTLGTRGKCLLAEFLAQRGDPGREAPALLQAADDAGDARGAADSALAVAARPKAGARWLELADRFLKQAREAEPDANDLIEKQALLRHLQRRFPEEIALYKELLGRKPTNYQFLNNMAWTLSEEMGDPKAGLNRADEALAKVGREPQLLDTRGVILIRLDRLDDAIRDLEAAADASPSGPISFHLARAYQKKGRAEDYQRSRDRAREAGLTPEQLQPSERGEWSKVMGD